MASPQPPVCYTLRRLGARCTIRRLKRNLSTCADQTLPQLPSTTGSACRGVLRARRGASDVSDPSDYKTRDLPAGLRLCEGGVTAVQGFSAANTSCGIKSEAGIPDLAMLVADRPCVTAATFTTSRTASHTIRVCKEHLAASGQRAQAVLVNSGNANCATGRRRCHDARRMAELTASN